MHEKGVNKNRVGALRRIRNLPPIRPKAQLSSAEEAANAAKQQSQHKIVTKESMVKFVDKKREMFLVQMMLDLKREEIRKLEEYAQLRK